MPAGEQFKRFFPGLVPDEDRVWRRFLAEHELEFDEFIYNVRVGEGVNIEPRPITADPELDRKLRKQFKEATQKRIDVVGVQGFLRWIFEVEVRPGTQALGQLLFYRQLLPTIMPVPADIVLAVVAEFMGPDNRFVFEQEGIRLFVFERGFPQRFT